MRLYVLILLFNYSLFSCPANELYGSVKPSPNFEILANLRDSGADVSQSLKEISLSNDHLTPSVLVNWDDSARQQLVLFGKHLRKAIHRKHLGFNSIASYEKPRETALEYFKEQINAYHQSIYSHREDFNVDVIVDDVVPGETIYFVKDMDTPDQVMMINFKKEYAEGRVKPFYFLPHKTLTGSVQDRSDGREIKSVIRKLDPVPEYWKDKKYELWELYLEKVKQD